MDRFRRPALRDRGMFNAACGTGSHAVPLPAVAAETVTDYSFSRWQVQPPTPAEVSPHPGETRHFLPGHSFINAKFSSADLEAISIDPDLGQQGMIASGEIFRGGGAGFLGGLDMSTVMIYSSGALLGVVGANIGRDGKDDLGSSSSDPTSYISDPLFS